MSHWGFTYDAFQQRKFPSQQHKSVRGDAKHKQNPKFKSSTASASSSFSGKSSRIMDWAVAGLTISLFRSAQHTACPDSAPLTVVSPHIDGIFKATSIMINIVQSLGQKNENRLIPKIACGKSSPAGTPISNPGNNASVGNCAGPFTGWVSVNSTRRHRGVMTSCCCRRLLYTKIEFYGLKPNSWSVQHKGTHCNV